MTDITNRSLAGLLVVAIVISIGGTWLLANQSPGFLAITGLTQSTDTGTAQLTVQTFGSIRFAVNSVNFGSGQVNTSGGNQGCILDTNGTNDSNRCENFTANSVGFQLENDGSANATIQLSFSNSASGFLGGDPTIAKYRYVVSNNETNSCSNSTGGFTCAANQNCTVAPIGWSDVNTTSPGTTICPKLLFTDLSDSLKVGINITIPYDSPSGAKLSTLTATATTAS
jgi:hypothetical protein